ncbi:DUF4190 domain-containing protein [Halalkalibacter nanhaiisediminis]|uniref:DUF4190 domain-containing protein n=1 Tax=Halalkalibacter nanhaiisediminis TaxID=688079 RepID=A0A562QM83_9BACI|nr:DUF4190 domain-containing protein [Halalkalibacter nanhaiisediminis]TWI57783.1 hypothetical protein IQ10_01106 [Halalkalibacter nanhaiisediminis]
MADDKHPKDEPVRLLDEDDESLTLVNNHVEGRDHDRNLGLSEEETNEEMTVDADSAPLDGEETLSDSHFNEESAAEYGAVNGLGGVRTVSSDRTEAKETAEMNEDDVTAGRGTGTFAIVLSILSLFFLPVLLGAAGIVVGFVARRSGATTLGNWAIGIGAISILMTVFFSPFF